MCDHCQLIKFERKNKTMEQDLLENPKPLFFVFMGWVNSIEILPTLTIKLHLKSTLSSFALKLVHFLFWMVCSLCTQLYCLNQKLTHLYTKYILNFVSLLQGESFECKEVVNCKSYFEKVPKHVVVIINEEKINYKVLSDIAVWNFLTGVENITLVSSSLDNKFFEKLYKKNLKNKGFSKNLKIELLKRFENVKLSSIEVERKAFIKKVQQMTENDCTNLTLGFTDSFLNNDRIQDPEVMISFGPYHSMYGYAPWNTRLTEFFTFKSHHNFTYLDFLSVFKSYSKCEQRVGK